MSYTTPSQVISSIAEQLSGEFRQRAIRLLPLRQADVNAAKAKAKSLLKSAAQSLKDQSNRATSRAKKDAVFLDRLVLAGALREAINARRNSKE